MNRRAQIGTRGEDAVVTYLQQQQFTIVARNYTKQCGEIDIIARKDDTLAFVEVKARCVQQFDLSSVITPSKQRKIITTAKQFIAQERIDNVIVRFDAALVIGHPENPEINYIENAFCETE